MSLTEKQVKQLLRPINPNRVLKDANGNSHVSQQDVTAHLTRIFGFEGWDKEILELRCIYERENPKNKKQNSNRENGWDVCYLATVRLTIRDPEGNVVTVKDDGSTGLAENQRSLGDGHDLAMKSAISLATKRAAKDLGDQFGLSLYNKGQQSALVKSSLVYLESVNSDDVQEGVEQQVSLGAVEAEPEKDPLDNSEQMAKLQKVCKAKGITGEQADATFRAKDNKPLKAATPDEVAAFTALIEQDAIQV